MSFFDVSDAEGVELEGRWDDVTSVDVCEHGDHPAECPSCRSAGLLAAVRTLGPNAGEWSECDECGAMYPSDSCCNNCVAAISGEGEDMSDEDQLKLDWATRLALLLDEATDLQLKSCRYALDREEKKRLTQAQETIRALDPDAPKQRKTRKDAGTTRARKEQAA